MAILIRVALVTGLLAIAAGRVPAVQQPSPLAEPQAKANFLYHLPLFVTFPPPANGGPLHICIAGVTPVTEALRAYDAQVVHGRRLSLRALREGDDIKTCHILFIPQVDSQRLGQVLQGLSNQPVITVGENDGFLEAGGMMRLVVRNDRLRFDVDLEPSDRAGITFDSNLLAQAASVTRGRHVVKP